MPSKDQNGCTQNTVKCMVGLSSSTGGAVVCSFGIYRASHLVAFLQGRGILKSFFFFFPFFKDYCATKWSVLRERFDRGLYASHADLHRLK